MLTDNFKPGPKKKELLTLGLNLPRFRVLTTLPSLVSSTLGEAPPVSLWNPKSLARPTLSLPSDGSLLMPLTILSLVTLCLTLPPKPRDKHQPLLTFLPLLLPSTSITLEATPLFRSPSPLFRLKVLEPQWSSPSKPTLRLSTAFGDLGLPLECAAFHAVLGLKLAQELS